MAVLQHKVIPRALAWAAELGAAFEAEETSFIHFTRNQRQRQLPVVPLYVDGTGRRAGAGSQDSRRDCRPDATVQVACRKGCE
jgi:hypothetical protein